MSETGSGNGGLLVDGVTAIAREQLSTGEIPSYRRGPGGGLLYQRSPFLSSFVHDALGCFDPRSPNWQEGSIDSVPEPLMGQFVWTVARIRRRIRAFLNWQAEPDGTWRFFGRASGIDPDANTTACAAIALLEVAGHETWKRAEQHARALRRFRAADGRYFTFVTAHAQGYGWMDPMGGPVVGFDQAVNAHILRFLVLSGSTPSGEMRRITDFVLEDQPPGVAGALAHSKLYPSPLAGYFSLARAWPHIQWQARSGVAERVIDSVLDLEDGPGDFGGPLRTALAAATLLDLGYGGPALERAGRVILDGRQTWGGWGYEDFIVGGFGSPAWTTALSLAVLARTHSRTGVLVA